MIYYISDTHFGHSNIIRMCGRPFKDIEEMDRRLIEKWNAKITNQDIVYFLGDFYYKCSRQYAINILKQLNGRKYFIKGNHDKVEFLKYCKQIHLIEDYFDYKEINDNGRFVILSHYPLVTWNGMYRNSYHLYGHVHDKTIKPRVKHRYNVCVEVINYEPKSLDELIERNKIFDKDNCFENFNKGYDAYNYQLTVYPNIDAQDNIYYIAEFPYCEACVGGGYTPQEAVNEAYESLQVFLDYLKEKQGEE